LAGGNVEFFPDVGGITQVQADSKKLEPEIERACGCDSSAIVSDPDSQKSDPVNPSQKRLAIAETNKENSEGSTKRSKREGKPKESQLSNALTHVGNVAEQLGVSKTESAVGILIEKYITELSEDDMVNAVSIFENVRKSKTFIAFKPRRV